MMMNDDDDDAYRDDDVDDSDDDDDTDDDYDCKSLLPCNKHDAMPYHAQNFRPPRKTAVKIWNNLNQPNSHCGVWVGGNGSEYLVLSAAAKPVEKKWKSMWVFFSQESTYKKHSNKYSKQNYHPN